MLTPAAGHPGRWDLSLQSGDLPVIRKYHHLVVKAIMPASAPDYRESIDGKLDEIAESARNLNGEDDAYGLLADLLATTARINALLVPAQGVATPEAAPSPVVSSLQGWIRKLKSALDALAKFLRAGSYTIGVSVPLGLSVLISFNV